MPANTFYAPNHRPSPTCLVPLANRNTSAPSQRAPSPPFRTEERTGERRAPSLRSARPLFPHPRAPISQSAWIIGDNSPLWRLALRFRRGAVSRAGRDQPQPAHTPKPHRTIPPPPAMRRRCGWSQATQTRPTYRGAPISRSARGPAQRAVENSSTLQCWVEMVRAASPGRAALRAASFPVQTRPSAIGSHRTS